MHLDQNAEWPLGQSSITQQIHYAMLEEVIS